VKTTTRSFAAWLEDLRPRVDEALRAALRASTLKDAPPSLRAAVEDALLSGGKRFRPGLAVLACRSLGGALEAALPAGVACEMIHAYSLVHDDLPCMDDDDLRRGRPTVHVTFGEATAVLAGDALQALAFEVLAMQHDAALARDQARFLAAASGPAGMVGGQELDLRAEGRPATLESVTRIHAAKTGALIGAALRMGVRAAGGDPAAWNAYASAIGSLFQATDDLLDATATTAELGKTAGKDAAAGKATLPGVLGLAEARDYAAARAERARGALAELPVRAQREELEDLPSFLMERCR